MLICLIYVTLESMQQWDQVVGEIMLLSGVRRRKTHYCAQAHWPRWCTVRDTRPQVGHGEEKHLHFAGDLGWSFWLSTGPEFERLKLCL